jgi:glycosyltransferase involved in cell wall biosynthesis
MSIIAMLLSNPFRPDPRVLKEATSLAERGHRVSIICWDRQREMSPREKPVSRIDIIRIQDVPSTYAMGARQLFHLPRFWLATFPVLSRVNPDLIHCHDFDTLPAGLWWGKRHHIPVIYDAHEYYADLVRPRLLGKSGYLLYRLIKYSERSAARFASAVITVDDTLGDIYRRIHPRVIIIGHYPPKSLAKDSNPIFSRPELTLLYIGRLSLDRGLLEYVDLLRSLIDMGVPARLRLAGVFTPIADEQAFRAHIQGLEDNIDLLGWIPYDRIPEILHSADAGLAIFNAEPRYIAAIPVKLFEYMAGGLPVIASEFPLIANIVNTIDCGALFIPDSNPGIIAQTIRHWWKNPDEAKRLGDNGRRSILEKYNWDTLAAELDDLYTSLVSESGS